MLKINRMNNDDEANDANDNGEELNVRKRSETHLQRSQLLPEWPNTDDLNASEQMLTFLRHLHVQHVHVKTSKC